ncbi:hypothetical protein [Erythrobacter sp. BLCC-B19]|uniref:hypothetical protein n=1 Tax=Erythrobacter sp. BLCC-B19 TaxID=3025315 RepID=UPI002360FC77|nr:hypothetical protein [Erythrobacter sp. BLCC-B19]WDA40237.1 hypothetical protein PS060_11780 [Erythrobacter sp. BLCC-B19]
MIARSSTIALAALMLAACASPDPLEGQRTVFNNPYAVPVIDRTGIGPQCNVARGEDATCLGVPITRNGRVPATAGLNRNQRRILRERAELLRQVSQPPPAATETPPPPPPPQPTLPTMDSEADTDKP